MGSEDDTAIPAEASEHDGEHLTGVVCPDCSGTLRVRREGGGFTFRCRIGHVYAAAELLAAKEHRLEQHLWSGVAALDELAALLRDLGWDPDRARRAQQDSAAMREIIERDDPVRLDACIDPGQRSGGREAP